MQKPKRELTASRLPTCALMSCKAASWDDSDNCPFRGQNSDMPSGGIEMVILRLLFVALAD